MEGVKFKIYTPLIDMTKKEIVMLGKKNNVNFQKGDFRAGIRYESYLNTLEGYPTSFNGTGLGYRYMSWTGEGVGVTIGNFYDQFGSGMIFRAYEERQLGIDNSMDGIRLTYEPKNGIYLKGMIGKQRFSFQDKLINGNGIIRAFDGELNLNELLEIYEKQNRKCALTKELLTYYNGKCLTENKYEKK